jgi:UDPglucose 6-dehydrogenase
MPKLKIGIVGSKGMVGSALKRYFETKDYEMHYYDIAGEGSLHDIQQADYIYICVPTPYKEGVGCDISAIDSVLDKIMDGKTIIIKSTVIPGTTDALQKAYPRQKFIFNPEFLTESTADQDMNYPDRQIIGFTHDSYTMSNIVLRQLPLATYEAVMPAFMAEFVKYAANTWFAVKVAKNNELYDIFKKFGGDDSQFEEMIDALSADKRIGRTHLDVWHKGFRGYDGKCLPKDTKSFIDFAHKMGVETPLMSASDTYNDRLLKSKEGKKNSSRNSKRKGV